MITKKWFCLSLQNDREIKDKFMVDYDNFMNGLCASWQFDRDGKLAAVILLDQYSRSLFRRTPRAFIADEKA